MKVKIKKLHENAQFPEYATKGSAGFDLIVCTFKTHYLADPRTEPRQFESQPTSIILRPFERVLIGCGFAVELPEKTELQVRSRSGLALKQGIIVLNAPGTVDSDYRGEVGAIICNNSQKEITITIGDRIAQAVLGPVFTAEFEPVEELSETDRGAGGYGSTGK